MPCDTRYETTPLDVSKFRDAKRLRTVFTDLGWVVREIQGGYEAHHVGGATVVVTADGARLIVSNYSRAPSNLQTTLVRAYAERTVREVGARFGMRVQSKQEQAGTTQIRMVRLVGR